MISDEEEKRLQQLFRKSEDAKRQFFECGRAFTEYAAYLKILVDTGKKSLDDYLNAYEQQLEIPHWGISATFEEYSRAVTKYDNEHYEERLVPANKLFHKTKTETERRTEFEQRLKDSSYSIAAYESYINWQIGRNKSSTTYNEEGRRQTIVLIERAIARDVTCPIFWLRLYHYWIRTDDELDVLQQRLQDATRCCPNCGEVWECYIRVVGRLVDDPQDVFQAYQESSDTTAFRDPGVILAVYLVVKDLENENQDMHLKLLQGWYEDDRNVIEQNYLLGRLWIESIEDTSQARAVWKRMLKHPANSTRSLFWLEYFRWEMQICNWPAARNVIKSACFTPMDNSQAVFDAAVQFELFHGSTSEYEKTLAVIKKASAPVDKALGPESEQSSVEQKRKFDANDTAQDDATRGKRQRIDTGNASRNREQNMVVIRNLSIKTTQEDIAEVFASCGQIVTIQFKELNEVQDRIALIEFEEPVQALQALQKDQCLINQQSVSVQHAEGTMLFVTNYPATFQRQDIEKSFAPHGLVLDIRLPSLLYDQSRRFAYVQMSSKEEARSAISLLNGTDLGGNLKLSVAMSDPDHKRERDSAVAQAREVFIRRVAWTATEEDLRELFSQYGSIVSIRLPRKFSDKHHDGICFVDFESAQAAKEALSLNGKLLNGMALEVSLSLPRSTVRPKLPKPSQDKFRSQAKSIEDRSSTRNAPDPPFIQSKTLGVMDLRDTVSEAQLRVIFEPYGTLRKVDLKHNHGGAIIEFMNAGDAGRASLALSGTSIDGQTITIGRYEDLMKQSPAQITPLESQVTNMKPRKIRGRPLPEKGQPTHMIKGESLGETQQKSKNNTAGHNQDYFRQLL